jgi:hypothetical protein
MTHIAKIAAAGMLAASITVPAAAQAGVLDLVQSTVLGQRQAHGITLDSVGKEVEPGIFQVDPRAVAGRRIVFSPAAAPPQLICFGSWGNGICKGILVDLRPQGQPAAVQAPPAPAPTATPQ